MTRDSLRATLDNLQVDPESAQDRPYLEAMLRRLGYTEKEIREELGPVLEADTTEPTPAVLEREYRLVVPARESAFLLEGSGHSDAPLEGRVQFEVIDDDGAMDEGMEFETLPEGDEHVDFETVDEGQSEEAAQPATALDETQSPWDETQSPEDQSQQSSPAEEESVPGQTSFSVEEDATLQDASLETFGDTDVQPSPKTRVRVKRVRARSRADAESQVATGDRRVIKSVPVDIVERWGDDEGGR